MDSSAVGQLRGLIRIRSFLLFALVTVTAGTAVVVMTAVGHYPAALTTGAVSVLLLLIGAIASSHLRSQGDRATYKKIREDLRELRQAVSRSEWRNDQAHREIIAQASNTVTAEQVEEVASAAHSIAKSLSSTRNTERHRSAAGFLNEKDVERLLIAILKQRGHEADNG